MDDGCKEITIITCMDYRQETKHLSISLSTVYGKTFKGENFRSFSADRESFPIESLAVYST